MKRRAQRSLENPPAAGNAAPGMNLPADRRKAVGVPLAQIVPRTLVGTPELIVMTQPRSFIAERFRRLRAVLAERGGALPRVIVVTSAAPGEGKSIVAANLALAMASGSGGVSSILVDADLRRPSVGRWLNPEPTLGLSDLLQQRATLEHAVISPKNTPLHLLPAGEPPSDPSDLLASERAKQLIDELREKYSRVIIDTPPIVPFTDAAAVGTHSDGFVLVARAGVTRVAALEQAGELAGSAPLLGTVLNDLEVGLADMGRSQGRGYYEEYYAKDREP